MKTNDYQYQFIAGNLALDFVNTVAYRFDPEKLQDHLQSAEELRLWANQACLPDCDAINRCRPMRGRALLRVRVIREQLFDIFYAIANEKRLPELALRRVAIALNACRAKQTLSVRGGEIRWAWRPGAGYADFVLYPILTAATDLLTSNSLQLMRQCADQSCGWLFLDRSNARQRRWCRMADCGNRHKAREHYRRAAASI